MGLTLHAAGLAVILDLHWPRARGVPAEGQRAMPTPRGGLLEPVATTFKDDRAVMYDLFNELTRARQTMAPRSST